LSPIQGNADKPVDLHRQVLIESLREVGHDRLNLKISLLRVLKAVLTAELRPRFRAYYRHHQEEINVCLTYIRRGVFEVELLGPKVFGSLWRAYGKIIDFVWVKVHKISWL
jgi:hypothetical protein